jgi:hypothetical protein
VGNESVGCFNTRPSPNYDAAPRVGVKVRFGLDADLHLEATEILQQLVKISTAVDTGNPAPHFRLVSDTEQEASTDRRQPPARRRLLKSGKILLGIDPIPCTIRNMSERGACLQVQTTAGIPAIFVFQRAGEPAARTCKTIWRDNTRIGFMFIQPE